MRISGNSVDRMTETEFTRGMTTTTETPNTICECGNGPFFYVPARQFPHLCLDCADHADRNEHGWTPENSTD